MQIAILKNGQITVGDYRDLFPNTSFPASGPTDDWIAEHGWPVSLFKQHNRDTQRLEVCDPYIDGGTVYTMKVVDLTNDEIAANQAQANAARKTAILAELASIDLKSIRALRDGYQPKIDELDAQAAALRAEMAAL